VTKTAVPGEPNPREAAESAGDIGFRRFDCTGEDPASIAEAHEAARQVIADGECIVLPTDTVYGIGVDAFSAEAVQRLLDAKNRGRDMPPPVLIAEPVLFRTLAAEVPDAAQALADRHWPGALTVICRIQPSLQIDLGDTEGTIALRVPDHELARDILRSTGPMAVSSANISGQPAAVTCDEAIEQLGDSVSVYLDGGPLGGAGGAPSTIVDFTRHDDGEVLRRGALSVETLRETVPRLRDLTSEPQDRPNGLSSGPGSNGADSGGGDDGSELSAGG
jgi:tRNA threonylcarbamoyl adenosine modification protein (Sua5/YciO/YrdC/YwlC family)